jgi:hypothetical protein
MSELQTVEFQDFARFLQSLNDYGKGCYFCGEASWKLTGTFQSDVDGHKKNISHAMPFSTLTVKGSKEKSEIMINNASSVLTRECGNCGHMSIFKFDAVLSYLNKLPPEEGK